MKLDKIRFLSPSSVCNTIMIESWKWDNNSRRWSYKGAMTYKDAHAYGVGIVVFDCEEEARLFSVLHGFRLLKREIAFKLMRERRTEIDGDDCYE